MWHEARKQERKIRGMIVDYRKRAERRQDFYEKIKADPTQFLQLHGRRCKIHLDSMVAAAGDGAAIIVAWQGQSDNLIDRFDVRAHLDSIPIAVKTNTVVDCVDAEERQCNYERYRILAQNDFLNVSEDKFLHQLYLEEQFGVNAQLEAERNLGKKKSGTGAAIGYSYDDSDNSVPYSHITNASTHVAHVDEDEESISSEIDMDVSIDISKLDTSQAHELNACGRNYGMLSNDFYSYLTKDVDEADAMRLAREEEQEKMMLSGRKSRRERRAQKERRVAGRPLSPPSYAAKEEPVGNVSENESESRSPSPENSGKITYITSFGGEDELQPHSKILFNLNKTNKFGNSGSHVGQATYAEKVKENLDKIKQMNEKKQERPKQYQMRSRSRSYGRYRRSSSRTRRKRSRSRSRSRGRRYRRSRSRSRSRSRRRRRYSVSSKSSTSSNARRGRGYRRKRSPSPPLAIKSRPQDKHIETAPIVPPVPEPVVAPPMVQYPTLPLQRVNPKLQPLIEPVKEAELERCPEDPPPIKRYYGRKRPEDTSDSDDNVVNDHQSSDSEESNAGERENPFVLDTDNSSDRVNSMSYPFCGSGYSGPSIGKQNSESAVSAHGINISSSAETKVGNCFNPNANSRPPLNPRERLKRKMQILLNKQYKADKKAEIEKTERQMQMQQEREDEMRELALKLRRRQRELRHKCGTPKSTDGERSSNEELSISKQKRRSRSSSRSTKKSAQSLHSSHRKSREEERPCLRRSPVKDRYRKRSRSRSHSRSRSCSRSRTSNKYHRRYSRNRSRNRRSCSRNHRHSSDRYVRRSTDRFLRRSRDRRLWSRRSRSRSRQYSGYNQKSVARSTSTITRYNNQRQPPPANTSERSNRNKVVISAPPKLRKLVDY